MYCFSTDEVEHEVFKKLEKQLSACVNLQNPFSNSQRKTQNGQKREDTNLPREFEKRLFQSSQFVSKERKLTISVMSKCLRSENEVRETGYVDSVKQTPLSRWDAEFFQNKQLGLLPRFGAYIIQNVYDFDFRLFGATNHEYSAVEPRQRLVLLVAAEIFFCFRSKRLEKPLDIKSRAGIYVGCSWNDFELLCRETGLQEYSALNAAGFSGSVISGRVAYHFNFNGPTISVDTACSSSLVALSVGIRNMSYSFDMNSLVCGVNLLLSPSITLHFLASGMLTFDGRCKTLDSKADGYVRSEGCSSLMCTEQNGKATGKLVGILSGLVNQDGRSNGLTAPNGNAQSELLFSSFTSIECDKIESLQVQMHGTGTALGDPIESSSYHTLFHTKYKTFSAIFSAEKSINGHSEPASGLSSISTACENLFHENTPEIKHLSELNLHIKKLIDSRGDSSSIEGIYYRSNSFLITRATTRMLASIITSFAFQGTNSCAILSTLPSNSSYVQKIVWNSNKHNSYYLYEKKSIIPCFDQYISNSSLHHKLEMMTTTFSFESRSYDAIVRDHKILDQILFPGTFHLDLSVRVCAQYSSNDLQSNLGNVVFCAPLLLKESTNFRCIVNLKGDISIGIDKGMGLQKRILPRSFSKCRSIRPCFVQSQTQPKQIFTAISKLFPWVSELRCSFLKVVCGKNTKDALYPIALDSTFQACVGILRRKVIREAVFANVPAKNNETEVPSSIEEVTYFGNFRSSAQFYASARNLKNDLDHIQKSSEFTICVNNTNRAQSSTSGVSIIALKSRVLSYPKSVNSKKVSLMKKSRILYRKTNLASTCVSYASKISQVNINKSDSNITRCAMNSATIVHMQDASKKHCPISSRIVSVATGLMHFALCGDRRNSDMHLNTQGNCSDFGTVASFPHDTSLLTSHLSILSAARAAANEGHSSGTLSSGDLPLVATKCMLRSSFPCDFGGLHQHGTPCVERLLPCVAKPNYTASNTKVNKVLGTASHTMSEARSHVLITGGLGGLGLMTTSWLSQSGGHQSVLSSRSGRNDITPHLLLSKAHQPHVIHIIRGDVSIREEIFRASSHGIISNSDYPKLAGIVHAGGILRDCVLPKQSMYTHRQVWSPKTTGSFHVQNYYAGAERG